MQYEEFKKGVSLRLKETRKKNSDTQEELAEKISISKENLSKIEQGRVNLTLENLFRIAELYHVSYDYLCKGESTSTFLNTLDKLISIEFIPCQCGEQELKYPVLKINQTLLDYLIQKALADRHSKMPDHIKELWKKELQNNFYNNMDNDMNKAELPFNTEFVLVKKDLIYPDDNKSDWKQSDLLREIDKAITQ